MEGRISKEAKGKGVARVPAQPPRTGRIKAQAPVNVERSTKLSLTLIGRVTNRTTQKVWSLIPFFTEMWKAEGGSVGSDLGNGLFQFQFENESDLLSVLERRPYHYARWMIILQRWEPTTSASFPSLIPFWIKVQGIPIHLWEEGTIRSLAEDFGMFEKADITDFAVRMRVQVNGLLPLVKSSVIEYSNGDEVTAIFVYERLEKHCSKCFRLDHEVKDCLVAKHQARERKLLEQSTKDSVMDNACKEDKSRTPGNSEAYRFTASREEDVERRSNFSDRRRVHRDKARLTSIDRQDSHPEIAPSLRRAYKEPPRDWHRSHSRSSYPQYSDSHRNSLTREDARHQIASKNRDEHLNSSRRK